MSVNEIIPVSSISKVWSLANECTSKKKWLSIVQSCTTFYQIIVAITFLKFKVKKVHIKTGQHDFNLLTGQHIMPTTKFWWQVSWGFWPSITWSLVMNHEPWLIYGICISCTCKFICRPEKRFNRKQSSRQCQCVYSVYSLEK